MRRSNSMPSTFQRTWWNSRVRRRRRCVLSFHHWTYGGTKANAASTTAHQPEGSGSMLRSGSAQQKTHQDGGSSGWSSHGARTPSARIHPDTFVSFGCNECQGCPARSWWRWAVADRATDWVSSRGGADAKRVTPLGRLARVAARPLPPPKPYSDRIARSREWKAAVGAPGFGRVCSRRHGGPGRANGRTHSGSTLR